MKPFYQKLATESSQSIIFLDEEIPHFTVPWHFHPEIEILLVVKSTGTSYIGDDISRFNDNDISIIGENIPHWWKSDTVYLGNKNSINTKAHIIQFQRELFAAGFFDIPEMSLIKKLLENSQRGIRFIGKTRISLGKRIKKIFRLSGIERVTELILLLDEMARSNEYRYHASIGYSKIVNSYDFLRFNKIHEYILQNFYHSIKLEKVASIVSMSPTAFCRYFKKHTNKTFGEFVTEFKIGHACKLITEENMSISRACYESGFNNLSNFNEQFRKVVKFTPSEYRAAYNHH